jgi:protein-L-isoaspartate(D-aspartate) O-methyltransferase
MLELLDVKEGNKILDVGSGSGWTTALLAFLAGKKSEVIGVERVKELVEFGQKNLQKYNFSHAKIIEAQKGKFGIPQKKFDRILVSAAYHEIPKDLLDQLEINGIMVVPVASSIFKVEKISEKEIRKEEFVGFTFVPLIK